MSNKRKKSKSVRTITKTQKALYGAIFVGLFAILIVFLLNIFDIYKLLYKPKGYLYVEPTFAAFAVLCVLIVISIILVIYFYGSFIDRKKALKQIRQKAKMILPIYLVLAIAASVFCFSCYYCIDDTASYSKNTLFGSEEILAKDDIQKIGIRVEKSLHSLAGKGPIFIDYYIVCTLSGENCEYVLNSDHFYSFRDMYDYLSSCNATVEADRSRLEELCEHQRNIPINFSAEKVNENIEYISKIFDLALMDAQ